MSIKGKPPTKDLHGREWHVYTLSDPRTNEVRYIGWTTRPKLRLASHVSEARVGRTKNHRTLWIASLLKVGVLPVFSIIESGFDNKWEYVEAAWIKVYRARGCKLTNCTNGGEGVVGYIPSEVTRARLSVASTGRIASTETRAKLSASLKGKKKRARTEEEKRKISIANTGRRHTTEAKKKISNSKIGKRRTPYTQAQKDTASESHPFRLKKFCRNGHEFTADNTYYSIRKETGRSRRACKQCRRKLCAIASRERHRRLKERVL